MTTPLFKFGHLVSAESHFKDSVPFHWPNVWFREKTTGPERLLVAPRADHVSLVVELTRPLHGPFFVLYVLLVPRVDAFGAGRYQSPPLERVRLHQFLSDYSRFFESDGRHHVWIASPNEGVTIVYDQHDWIYAYGPLDAFEHALERRGLRREAQPFGGAPVPHTHHYHQEFDETLREFMREWSWIASPLRHGDDY